MAGPKRGPAMHISQCKDGQKRWQVRRPQRHAESAMTGRPFLKPEATEERADVPRKTNGERHYDGPSGQWQHLATAPQSKSSQVDQSEMPALATPQPIAWEVRPTQ